MHMHAHPDLTEHACVHAKHTSQHRFVVFHIEFQHACQRKFDAHGKEIEPNFGATQLVRTGYLQSSYSELGVYSNKWCRSLSCVLSQLTEVSMLKQKSES